MPATPTTDFAIREAASELRITERHIRRLVREGRLQATGEGQRRRITRASVEKYKIGRKFADIYADMSSRSTEDLGYQRIMVKILKTVPALSLPRNAARRLGIPAGELDDLLKAGHIPTVAIGPQRFIPATWLARMLTQAYGVKGEL